MPNTRIVRQSLRLYPVAKTYGPTSWGPAFSFDVRGAIPSGSQIIVDFKNPDGSDWLTSTVDVNEQGESGAVSVSGAIGEEELQTAATGVFPFSVRLVSELEGVDQPLAAGKYQIEALPSGKAWRSRADFRLASGQVQIDAAESDPDAPVLTASFWLGAGAEEHHLAAYLFFNGKKIRSSETREADLSSEAAVPQSDGNAEAREFRVVFKTVRGYVNGGYGDADQWHDLSKNPGKYEIKLAREKKLDRVLAFEIGADGKMVATGPVEPLASGALRMHAKVLAPGKADTIDAALAAEPWFGVGAPEVDLGVDALYPAYQGLQAAAAPVDEALEEELERVGGAADNIRGWHWDDLENGSDAHDFPLQCEMAIRRVDEALPGVDALAAKAPDRKLDFDGGDKTIAEVRAALVTIKERAQAVLDKRVRAASGAVAPYRAALRGDKLRVFLDRPAPDYRYYAAGKREITTPEELAAAAAWYFEGSEDQGLITEKWTVKGYHFEADHKLRETSETNGFGTRAPSSAFP